MRIHNFRSLDTLRVIKPKRLKEGDTIGIVAPAWAFEPEYFRKGVDKLKNLGFKVKYDRSIFSKYWSMAGYHKQRADQINAMFADKEVKAILCAKAGYGSIRTLPYLNKEIIRRNPKIFVGYSDITILLSYLYKTARMIVFHGPVVSGEIRQSMHSITLDYLLRAITDRAPLGEFRFPHLKTLKHGTASGILVGGTLSLVVNTIGTPYEIDTDNKILFLEDIGEDLESLDSYIMQLKLAGKLRKVKGIIFGRMVDCVDDLGHRYSIQDMLNDILQDVDVPIIYGFPSGHMHDYREINITLPFGVMVSLDANDSKVVINEAGVK